MAVVQIIGRKGSKSRKTISEHTGIRLFTGKGKAPDVIVNYGLAGRKLDAFLRKTPKAKEIPIINKYVGRPKHLAIRDAEKAGVSVPETRLSLPRTANLSDWIEKRMHSSQGLGIKQATHRGQLLGKYYQKMIKDRRYELRVHAFLWLPEDEWVINKRTGPASQIAWNFHQGGHFSSVRYPNKYKVFKEAKDISKKVLEVRDMAFGAVDLIVDNNMKVYFIEVNSSPGFSVFSEGVYVGAMNELKALPSREARKFGRR